MFNDFICKMEVVDLPLCDRKFTRFNPQEDEGSSRFDRDWPNLSKLVQWGLQTSLADHCPILLVQEDKTWGPKPFKFVDAWLSHLILILILKRPMTN